MFVVALPMVLFHFAMSLMALLSLNASGPILISISGGGAACYVLGARYMRLLWHDEGTERYHRRGMIVSAIGVPLALVGALAPSWMGLSFLGVAACGLVVFD